MLAATETSRVAGVTWTVGAEDSVSVEETGPEWKDPPVLVVAGRRSAVLLAVPAGPEEWSACVTFLLRLRDGAGELAEMLAGRVADPGGRDECR
ncbi:hypothetical protein SAMN05421837_112117 [Amycolatopsis pretoriensis]|uniref:Uncharacterized protein n=1 Tax=Amycolatopsis pretoriensis TaxID=218821 RepID=A0A1H5RF26_9PSEU|nr:hypothetical protein [Amycolatopsis pretoriensis]SEF37006.1 hypothetical protein SAMN05421837_112117 [Amycolatopsis pretoriensis]